MSVHVAYGGAHLFQTGTASKWASLAVAAFDTYLPTPAVLARAFDLPEELAAEVHRRVAGVLRSSRALTSLRIDFEDGYGIRDHAEEDAAARAAATTLASLPAGPALGIRPKSFAAATRGRALRTLACFFDALSAPLPHGFVVTLAKVQNAHEVALAVGALATFESRHGLAPLDIELMAETPGFFTELEHDGLSRMVQAGEGRLRSLHFGAYDMLSALGVPGHQQSLQHAFCDPLRLALAKAAAPFDLPLYDGATLAMPVPTHKSAAPGSVEMTDNHTVVLAAMAEHARNCEAALALGFAGSWDLHPAQLVPRHVATTAFYLRALPSASRRLAAFLNNAARATRAGQTFDDAASARGLLRFVAQGLEAGAVTAADLAALPVSALQLQQLSFDALVAQSL